MHSSESQQRKRRREEGYACKRTQSPTSPRTLIHALVRCDGNKRRREMDGWMDGWMAGWLDGCERERERERERGRERETRIVTVTMTARHDMLFPTPDRQAVPSLPSQKAKGREPDTITSASHM